MKKYGFRNWEAVLAAIGHGGLKEGQVVNRLLEEYEKKNKKELTDAQILEAVAEAKEDKENAPVSKTKGGITVKGIHDVAVRFSKCCTPVPGDEIVGFVTRGRGVSIHRTDCVNVMNMRETDRVRLTEAEWELDKSGEKYSAEIKLYANNRTGILADISKITTERAIDVTSMNVRINKQGVATIVMAFDIRSVEELNRLIDKMRQIDSIIDIERI
jgi:GTP pyrophosphokinase